VKSDGPDRLEFHAEYCYPAWHSVYNLFAWYMSKNNISELLLKGLECFSGTMIYVNGPMFKKVKHVFKTSYKSCLP